MFHMNKNLCSNSARHHKSQHLLTLQLLEGTPPVQHGWRKRISITQLQAILAILIDIQHISVCLGQMQRMDRKGRTCLPYVWSEVARTCDSSKTGGAFAVYQQLSEEEKANVDYKLCKGTNLCKVWGFCVWAILWMVPSTRGICWCVLKLAILFGDISDHGLACAFVKGLPNHMNGSIALLLRWRYWPSNRCSLALKQ